jgi:uncharacterized protein involved in response to NO
MPKAFPAHKAFYPAAALYGAAALPASVLAMLGYPSLPALAQPLAHAHEMLLGFALAVVAGNQLGVASGSRVAVLLALWAAARVAFLAAPASLAAAGLNAAFAASLALQAAPRLFGAAKKLRNQALPATLVALCAAAAAWQAARFAGAGGVPRPLMLATVGLFALLMLFMGGRVVAPAVAGQLYRQGDRLDARVQPRLEGALIVACAAGVAALLAAQALLAGAALALAGALAAVRIARWRLWALRGRPDLLCLAAGYAWLALGLVALGASLALGGRETAALHLITVGALGSLTFNVMLLSWTLRARGGPAGPAGAAWGTALVAAATLFRVAGAFGSPAWLLAAAAGWTLAFLLLLALFAKLRRA